MAKQTAGEFLAMLRKAHGYTQSEIAEKLNISDRTLSSWETDRTMPDLLLLPALADLYGVTVDEILRGERSEKSGNTISKNALIAARKNNYGKFISQSTLIAGIAIIGSFILLLTSVILPFTVSPLWLDILLGVFGGVSIVVSLVLLFYFEYRLRIKEGIILKEDLTQENKQLLLSSKRKIISFTLIISLILALVVFILVMELIFLWLYLLPFILLIIYSVTGLALFIFSLIYRKVNIINLGTEEQIGVLKTNRKYALKVYGLGTIPAVVLLLICTVCCIFLQVTETAYFESKDFNAFRDNTQTLTFNQGDTAVNYYNYSAGDYVLQFPENPQEDTFYELNENGIYGKKAVKNAWNLYYKYNDEYRDIKTVLIMKLNGNEFVNVRYSRFFNFVLNSGDDYYSYNNVKLTINEKFWGEQEIQESFKYKKGKYGFYEWVYNDYTSFMLVITLVSVYATYFITTVIYFVKQKKIKYEF